MIMNKTRTQIVIFIAVAAVAIGFLIGRPNFGFPAIQVDHKEAPGWSSPEKVVDEYCGIVIEGKFDDLKKFLSPTPREYHKFMVRKAEEHDTYSREDTEPERSDPAVMIVEPNWQPIDDLHYKYLSKGTPQFLYDRGVNKYLIKSTEVNGNFAKIEVQFYFENKDELPIDQELLMVKDDMNWSIFRIRGPVVTDTFPN